MRNPSGEPRTIWGCEPVPALSFAACFVYAPRGVGSVCDASRTLCTRVKAIDVLWLPRYVGLAHRATLSYPYLAELFRGDAVLVPVPGSASRHRASWVALHLALALRDAGLVSKVWPGLHRHSAIRKSATALSGHRPTVLEHYQSFSVDASPMLMHRIVLIDDVVTKGRTLLAAAARIRARFPDADVRAFALIRTVGYAQRLERLMDPCQGVIRWSAGDALRVP